MSAETIHLTHEAIAEITRRVAEKADSIDYEVTAPDAERAAEGARLYWAKVVENEDQYIDGPQDGPILEGILLEAGITEEDLFARNESLEVELSFLPSGETQPASLEQFRVALWRYMVSDFGSAWMSHVREIIEDMYGVDPLGHGDGLIFPEDD